MGVGGQRHAPVALPPGKTRYPLYGRLGALQGRSGQVRKISPLHRDSIPGRPVRSESLNRLSFAGLPSPVNRFNLLILWYCFLFYLFLAIAVCGFITCYFQNVGILFFKEYVDFIPETYLTVIFCYFLFHHFCRR